MRIAQEYKISKTQLLADWYLDDIFDAAEYLDIQAAMEEEQRKESERSRK